MAEQPAGSICIAMPISSAFDRFRSFTKTVRDGLLGVVQSPCDQFQSFEVLLQAFSSDGRIYTAAYLCFQERYLGVARQVARNFRGHDEEVMEALDDVLIAVRQRIRKNHLFTDEAHFRSFVWRVLKNKLIDRVRDRRGPIVVDVTGLEEPQSIDPDVDYLLMNEAVMAGLQKISAGCRQKLLWVATGHSYQDIADQTKGDARWIKHQIRECRAKLKAELVKLGIEVDWPRNAKNKPDEPV
ncbi:sigma-70 family RNA polymerase sigma factor [uncultured Spirosoma sp.]|uniref:sigma-70 family RNA polymerase sigma factor n=1 Tax=uncultured Spirosoma sp. TaxID=278208 RepID=UPI00258324E2|nr:sigma-70 family RNA polymerase sigma factor [uncultured Spirosoma sp.]